MVDLCLCNCWFGVVVDCCGFVVIYWMLSLVWLGWCWLVWFMIGLFCWFGFIGSWLFVVYVAFVCRCLVLVWWGGFAVLGWFAVCLSVWWDACIAVLFAVNSVGL